MPKLLMITTIAITLKSFLLPHAKFMQEEGWIVDGMANGISENEACINTFNSCFEIEWSRNPLDLINIIKATEKVAQIVSAQKYDIVHVHTPIAAAVTRFALRKLRKNKQIKVVYTAHGFHFYKGSPLLNWIIYYPIERFLSRYTDVLITINKEDYAHAKKFHAAKVEYIPGVGIDIKKIQSAVVDKVKKRREVGIPEDAFLFISVGELNKNKNHEAAIRALSSIKDNEKIYYIIAGEGCLKERLTNLIADLGMDSRVRLLGFRTDVVELLKASDCFIFPSLREGLPVALMEAMAAGLPVVCSNIRGNVDLVEDGVNGYLFQISDMASLVVCLDKAVQTSGKNMNDVADIMKNFSLCTVLAQMQHIYYQSYSGGMS